MTTDSKTGMDYLFLLPLKFIIIIVIIIIIIIIIITTTTVILALFLDMLGVSNFLAI
jgi:hypothetical protein